MKTRIKLLTGILGLSALISFPAIAQEKTENSVKDAVNDATESMVESAPDSLSKPLQEGEKVEMPATTDTESTASNLVEQAASNDQFQTLVKAIEAAGLTETLAGEGPYTVFAPTNDAFAALPANTLDSLLQPENKDVLVKLLKYHVVSGVVPSSEIQSGEIITMAGKAVTVHVGEDGNVNVNNAQVTQADIEATNGIIHVVDHVILPSRSHAQSEPAPTEVRQNSDLKNSAGATRGEFNSPTESAPAE
ncbi:MAG: fasciclin domain-containing protein [Moorea sp. SIOASIH]|uniref:fasciclin domain-containing protein n=1 Tax=Moorena sp. SIOASIH TaxID=2607817 RepID=UPI0013B7EE7B|nr:fasciclin domain-containing protein [Moorena sp. SIOASIH]NEO42432.1 fasciclin domain-containing protein [Moorena sp. SIOASIH]